MQCLQQPKQDLTQQSTPTGNLVSTLMDGERLTAGGRLGLYQLHPPCLIANPAVSLVHKVSQIIDDF